MKYKPIIQKSILVIFAAWIILSILRTSINLAKVFNEEGKWITMTVEEKRNQLFGVDYRLFKKIGQISSNITSVYMVAHDAKSYLFGRYMLYPLKIYHIKEVNKLSGIADKKDIIVVLYNLDLKDQKLAEKLMRKSSEKFEGNIFLIVK